VPKYLKREASADRFTSLLLLLLLSQPCFLLLIWICNLPNAAVNRSLAVVANAWFVLSGLLLHDSRHA